MVSTFTPNLGLQLQATGDNSSTWGVVLNSNVFTPIDTALGGAYAANVAGSSNVTLSAANALNLVHDLTGILTGSIQYIFPAGIGRMVIINNQTTGAYTVTVLTSGGTGVVVPQGIRSIVNFDPSNNTAYIPNGYLQTALAAGDIFIGNGSGVATAQAVTGAIAINTAGSATLNAGVVLGTNLGTNVVANLNLALMAPNTIKGNNGTATSSAADNSLSSYLDASLGTSIGQIAYRGTSTWQALSPGTIGKTVVSGGSGVIPSYTGPNQSQTSVLNPTGTTSSTAVMMGLSGSITPVGSGIIKVEVAGNITNVASTIQISYGTGSAPANGAALTGTQIGSVQSFSAATGNTIHNWSIPVIITGLSVGTAYWLDVAVSSTNGSSTATITSVQLNAYELK